MFKSYFSEEEMENIEERDKQMKCNLDAISRSIKDIEERFNYYLVKDCEHKFSNYTLIYKQNRIFFKDETVEKRLIETPKETRLMVAPFLHEFARKIMLGIHRENIK